MSICKKLQQHRKRIAALEKKYTCDYEELDRIKNFFEKNIKHWKEPFSGAPFVPEEWQYQDILRPLLCFKRADGTRLFREAYIQLPRKNGKTSLAAAILLYIFCTDGEGLEIYSAATKSDQAKIVFNDCVNFVRASPALSKRMKVFHNRIEFPKTKSVLTYLASEAKSLDGLNISAATVDEVHAHKDAHLLNVLRTATGTRRQPLILEITTAGAGEQGVCFDQYQYSSKLLGGVLEDDSFFAYIVEADKELEWNSEEAFFQANPNLGVSISRDYLLKELKKAKEQPSYKNTYQRYHLNRWVQASADSWIDLEKWKKNAHSFTEDELAGEVCYAGLDLASKIDLTALSLIFPREDGTFKLLTYYWMPEDNLHQRVSEDKVPYDLWQDEGWLEVTPGNVIDTKYLTERIISICRRFNVKCVSYDPAFCYDIFPRLQEEGLEVVEFRQTLSNYTASCLEFEKVVTSGTLKHNTNPITNWCASNVKIFRSYDGRCKPEKSYKSSKERIDGIVASLMALDGWIRNNKEAPKSEIDYSIFPTNFRSLIGV